jgi:hypothetical protein
MRCGDKKIIIVSTTPARLQKMLQVLGAGNSLFRFPASGKVVAYLSAP